MSESILARCRVVLVRPHFSGNLGSVARVMRNFGLKDLVLVAPLAKKDHKDATMMAVHGIQVLQDARVVLTLAGAIADCGFVVATSGEVGGLMRKGYWGTPEEKVPAVLAALDRGPAALVFGPEPSGLTVDEITACHGMMYIPADDVYPSLNLAQAVAVCLYELRKQWLKRQPDAGGLDPPAGYAEQERMFAHLKESLAAVRFLWDFRSEGIYHVVRHVITRAMPTTKELRIFHGLAKQLLYVANRWGVTHPIEGRPPPVADLEAGQVPAPRTPISGDGSDGGKVEPTEGEPLRDA
ncbi:RNA methyltransferase [Fimbriiglobus ruber]|uniref:tRNA (cytidine/uridine-2'-O-)-methyltransferase TrmJ n=1 Tax=Fimbriiglobus ruber TaxID=1908690 RepID=A0A225DPD4_9BACT|nr:RNA methyltransferase [Fimbriiglobus ruber]OWK43161.1 tRNA:Cm32/Um32 methyltransferase [Fimbriiglobus ruber]